ncbi:hypothetical protein M0G43_11655 [Subsaxibacter sp. CAU 1640]|uniref:hypothetical protein n=1 Tax=Subsaxibacter sp. CAU 1640 TaxID=2933271 RepID=UPI002002BCA3|nr:hypothetical protein [Subsaxibacter sp. CAU 1640]MCK7591232.1 hypothetical protein [Subsaxibacter sp. CAU 1640]
MFTKFKLLRSLIQFLPLILLFNCSNPSNDIFVEEFNWQLSLPNELVKTEIKEIEKSKEKGIKTIEEAYNQRVIITAKKLFDYQYENHKYNNISAQYKILDSTKSFLNEFKRASEIMMNSVKYKFPDLEIEPNYSTQLIDGLEFQLFELKLPGDDGVTTTFINVSNIFDDKMLDVLIVYQDSLKGKKLFNAVVKSTFN